MAVPIRTMVAPSAIAAGMSADMPMGAIDGDALHEGDDLATGLYKAMLLLRSDKDLNEDEFANYADCREETLEDADEIWRAGDSLGNVLVSFIKEFNEEEDFYYVVVTVEDAPSGSHALATQLKKPHSVSPPVKPSASRCSMHLNRSSQHTMTTTSRSSTMRTANRTSRRCGAGRATGGGTDEA